MAKRQDSNRTEQARAQAVARRVAVQDRQAAKRQADAGVKALRAQIGGAR